MCDLVGMIIVDDDLFAYSSRHLSLRIDSKHDNIGIDCTLFGDIICIVGVDTFPLDVVGDVESTQLLVKIHTNCNKPIDACL